MVARLALSEFDVGRIADWLSMVSFVLTFTNTLLIVTIRRRIAANLTLEPLHERLKGAARELNQCLNLFDASAGRFNAMVAICEVDVETARRRLGIRRGWMASTPISLLKAIKRYKKTRDRYTAEEVYSALTAVIEYMRNEIEERRISGS